MIPFVPLIVLIIFFIIEVILNRFDKMLSFTMIELTEKQIEEINAQCPEGQGIFFQPFGIPDKTKELVIYMKWQSGWRGGSCWDDEDTVNEHYDGDRPNFEALELALKIIKPDISHLKYNEILCLKQDNTETDYGYYGDYTEDTIEWIVLSDLYKLLS